MSFFGALFSMAALGTAMAALSLGAIFHVYGKELPEHEALSQYRPKEISRVYSAEGQVIDEFKDELRLYTPAADIPDLVKQAFISAEDQRFLRHDGYDVMGIAAALRDAVRSRGADLRGASTITQQVAKNLLLSSDQTIERKVKEIILASRIEATLTKDDILEIYLNEIDLGVQSFGVTAAARSYFNKPLTELTAAEAAFLAIHPKAPYTYNPATNMEGALERRAYVLGQMLENGYLTEEEHAAAIAEPIRTVQTGDIPSYQSNLPPRDYFTAAIRNEVPGLLGIEGDQFDALGLSIRATVDAEMQQAAADALRRGLEQFDRGQGLWRGTGRSIPTETLQSEAAWRDALGAVPLARDIDHRGVWRPAVVREVRDQELLIGIEDVPLDDARGMTLPRSDTSWFRGNLFENFEPGDVIYVSERTEGGAFDRWTLRQIPEVQGGFMAMDVNTGRVLAIQGGFDYEIRTSELNRATQARRQPGSAFKPFVYAAALDSGYTPATIVVDAPIEVRAGGEIWRPTNASNRFYGPTPVRTGIEQSRNLMTVRLAQEVGMDVIADYAERFGVYDDMDEFLSAALGSQETTLYRIVAAYAMFANGGERVEPTLVDRVQDRYGRTLYQHDQRICNDCQLASLPAGEAPGIVSNRERVMNGVTAYQLTSMMQGVVQRGTAARTVNLPVPTAGKTGTTNDAKDVWFVGFTSNIVAGCYIGYDQPRSMGGVGGGGMCGPVFDRFMETAVQRYGGGKFSVPDECRFIKIDRFSGARLPDSASGENVVSECFRLNEEPVFGITFDGGFAMSANLPLFEEAQPSARQVTNSSGGTATVGPKADFGSLSSGGLY